MIYDAAAFEFVPALEANWRAIRGELERLDAGQAGRFVAWPERFLYNQGWDVFGLYGFGRKLEANCELCPETARLVERIPGMTTAGFSKLAPGTRIQPHTGYTSAVLRCHLGLIVNESCGLRVGATTLHWDEGKCIVFDDTVEHEAWNEGATARMVLLIDFLKRSDHPLPRGPA